jgi:two-component system, LuxR family, sensor kinase FixL
VRNRRKIPLATGFFAGYLLLAWLCHVRPAFAPGITPWHPQTGLALAFLLACGPSWSVWVGLTALTSELLLVDPAVPVNGKILAAGCIALGYAGLAVWLRALLPGTVLRTTGDAARIAGAAGVVTLLVAAAYVASYLSVVAMPRGDALRGIARYWLADVNGVLMLTPLLALRERYADSAAPARRRVEVLSQFSLVLALPWMILSLPDVDQLRFFYLLFVPVIWIALRWNWTGALPAVIVIQSMLILAAEAEVHTPRFVDLQFLLLTLSLSALLLGAVVAERRRSEVQLREREIALSRAMRFAVAGELASALAHELNQPITALVSYLNASEMMANAAGPEDPRLRATLRKAGNEAIRAADVLHRLRNLYIGGVSRRDPVDVLALCHAMPLPPLTPIGCVPHRCVSRSRPMRPCHRSWPTRRSSRSSCTTCSRTRSTRPLRMSGRTGASPCAWPSARPSQSRWRIPAPASLRRSRSSCSSPSSAASRMAWDWGSPSAAPSRVRAAATSLRARVRVSVARCFPLLFRFPLRQHRSAHESTTRRGPDCVRR